MMEESKIEGLKEKLKKGTISYFSLSEEESKAVEQSLKEEINQNKKEIEDIREKIKAEKKKFQN